jgi:hypothetical protein
MNSEPWRDPLQELWQRQPVPPVQVRPDERILRVVQDAEIEWERETGEAERATYWMWPVFVLPPLLRFYFWHEEFWWGEWLLQVSIGATVLTTLLAQRRRQQCERDFGQSLLGRIERGRALLAQRLKFTDLNLFALPIVPVAVALLIHQGTGGSMLAAVIAGGAAAGLFGCWAVAHRRKFRAQLRERITELDAMRAELAALASDGA